MAKTQTYAEWLDEMWLKDIASMEERGAISAEEAKQLREAAHATETHGNPHVQ